MTHNVIERKITPEMREIYRLMQSGLDYEVAYGQVLQESLKTPEEKESIKKAKMSVNRAISAVRKKTMHRITTQYTLPLKLFRKKEPEVKNKPLNNQAKLINNLMNSHMDINKISQVTSIREGIVYNIVKEFGLPRNP